MRTLCPNYDREDALETVLEVPIPEEMFPSTTKSWKNMKSWMRSNNEKSPFFNSAQLFGGGGGRGRNAEIQLLLGVAGAPLIPLPLKSTVPTQPINLKIKDHPIEASMAKYIVKQYIAAVGGEKVIDSINSMYAMGQVKMVASDLRNGGNTLNSKGGGAKVKSSKHGGGGGNGSAVGGGEMGGFVLWQKRPELWCLELVVSGCKISAGSDGKVAWRQTPWHNSHASRGPPRPLRRSLQGLDPRATANLFINSTCIGEKAIAGEECFILKLEAQPLSLKARSSNNVEIIRHTVWGYFSQKTGLLIQLEDSHLLRIKSSSDDGIFWETTMESLIQDYRTVDGLNIAHGGKTSVSLFRFGESSERHSRTRMEETWTIEEVDFNIKGLSMVCFIPPSDMKIEADFVEEEEDQECNVVTVKSNSRFPFKIRAAGSRVSGSRVVAIDDDDEDCHEDYDDE